MDILYTFGDIINFEKTESVHFLGLMNSATKKPCERLVRVAGRSRSELGFGAQVPVLYNPGLRA